MDRRVISPSLLNLEWEDLTKFPFKPDFDLGTRDFLPDLTLLTDKSSRSISPSIFPGVTNGQVQLPGISAASSCLNAEQPAENPHKHLKLSLHRSLPAPLKDATNQPARTNRFAAPVTSSEREKAAKGVILANTESNTQWAVRTYNT